MPDNVVRPQTRLGGLLVSEEAVYGLILVAGMVLIGSERADEAWETMVTVLVTVLVFFAAHVYAGTLSRMAGGKGSSIPTALGGAVRHSIGLLVVAVPPLAVLVVGASGVITPDAAVWLALIITAVLLIVDGWLMAAARTSSFWVRLLGAAISGAFGAVLIVLKVLIHH
ncbi:hypothetical protein ET475_15280 [Microbacterium protaetiae]|uniref:Uncharacterized protein n=1 Tax=Microbacterium protaetiae TaxID=2509458 RepID=A0A4P6ELV4_9MICO|nr:hypothetical protein [Microbacterium protaetiae]QAY61207.1 hypothetical protein ET475_15280 [Microbacterium protaetiae]